MVHSTTWAEVCENAEAIYLVKCLRLLIASSGWWHISAVLAIGITMRHSCAGVPPHLSRTSILHPPPYTLHHTEAGLRKRHARQRVLALSQGLQQLSRSQARGGIHPYRALPGGTEAAAASAQAAAAQLAPGSSWQDDHDEAANLLPAPSAAAADGSLAVPQWGPGVSAGRSLALRTRSGRLSSQVGTTAPY